MVDRCQSVHFCGLQPQHHPIQDGGPTTSTRQVILVGTADAEITPSKTEKRSGGVCYHNLPKGTRTIEISIKKEDGTRLNEIIFR